ncbi:MAG: quinone oxidoreductase [Nostocoides sp.]
MARALVVPHNGGSDVLTVWERPDPVAAAGVSLVDVAAIGVNFVDVYQRQGVYPLPTPFVLCSEGAGTIVGSGARVAWASHLGSGASRVAVPDALLVPVPDGLGLETAAAAMLQGMTAHYLVNSTYAVQPGDICLVHAAAGGVGQFLVQMIKAKGGTVVATAGSDEKLAIATELGADAVVNYSAFDDQADLAVAVRSAAGGGVHAAYDGVGKATFDASLASLRPRGIVILFGGASGQVPPFDLQRLNAAGSAYVTRPTLGSYLLSREELLWRGESVLGDLASGRLTLEIGGRYPLDQAATAYDDLEARRTTGKLLLIP